MTSAKTTYRVLRFGSDKEYGFTWWEVATVDAHGPVSAIKEAAGEESGLYVAVPDRSWQPLQVNVATKRVVTTEKPSVSGDAT